MTVKTRQTGHNEELIPLRSIPGVNVFQYPPAMPAGPGAKEQFAGNLALTQRLAQGEEFTMFVSIPYCKVRCNSCPYFKAKMPKGAGYDFLDPYVSALETQMAAYAQTERFRSGTLAAIYMGGGTASLLSADQVRRIVGFAKSAFRTSAGMEITLEGNPSDFNRAYYAEVVSHGINRLSIGYQSADSDILVDKLGSPHNASEGLRSLQDAIQAGFRTVNVDMLYGIPGQKLEQWQRDLGIVIGLGPESVTTYSYIVYGNTVAELRIRKGTLDAQIDDDEKHRWYLYTKGTFEDNGYVLYKKGHFIRPGHPQAYSDLSYRVGTESLGIGAGAYSFVNGYLFMSVGNPKKFTTDMERGLFTAADFQSSQANTDARMAKYLMHSVATGTIDVQEFRVMFGTDPRNVYRAIFEEMSAKGLTESGDGSISMTDRGTRWQQNIMSAFYHEGLRRA
jgi:oxygen-independent coproporphyrinogen-3 oxidase